jgi:hypothetical protein
VTIGRPLASARGCSVTAFGVAALLGACGGSEPEAKAPAAEAARSHGASEKPASDATEAKPEKKPKPVAQRCADGTCFACGAGYCPIGFYCDESAKGGASCSWLPSCAGKSGCGCLARALASCKCEDAQGGPHVRCEY